MTTPSEKATQLIDKYRTIIRISDKYGYLLSDEEIHLAKQCAIVCVNEVIDKDGYNNDYWQEVKAELEKL